MNLFDTHCHLDVADFDGDREAVFARAREAGVVAFLNPAYDLASSARAAALAAERGDVWAAVGIHPNGAHEANPDGLNRLEGLLRAPRVVALGEIGLDYHWNSHAPEVARRAFADQIVIARAAAKPIIIHCREAMADTLATLADANRGASAVPVLLHAFSGDEDQALEALRRGYTLGLGGPLTYRKAEALRRIAAAAPLGQIVLETDAPYLSPHPFRGQRNEPARVALVAERLAAVRGVTADAVAEATTATARRFFGLPA